jgi:hypothetical protein
MMMARVHVVTNALNQIIALQSVAPTGSQAASGYVPQAGETVHTLDVPEDLGKLDLLALHQSVALSMDGGKARLVHRAG